MSAGYEEFPIGTSRARMIRNFCKLNGIYELEPEYDFYVVHVEVDGETVTHGLALAKSRRQAERLAKDARCEAYAIRLKAPRILAQIKDKGEPSEPRG